MCCGIICRLLCWTCLETNKQLHDWLLCGRYGVYEIKPRQFTDANVAPLLNEIFRVFTYRGIKPTCIWPWYYVRIITEGDVRQTGVISTKPLIEIRMKIKVVVAIIVLIWSYFLIVISIAIIADVSIFKTWYSHLFTIPFYLWWRKSSYGMVWVQIGVIMNSSLTWACSIGCSNFCINGYVLSNLPFGARATRWNIGIVGVTLS